MTQEKHGAEGAWLFKELPPTLPASVTERVVISWGARAQPGKDLDMLEWQPMIMQEATVLGGAPFIVIPGTDETVIPISLIEGIAIGLGNGKGFHYAGLCRELHITPEQILAVLNYAEWDDEIDGIAEP